jgi:hypothetical protein
MTAVYSVVYFDDASAYDVLLWCAPDIPWTEDDGMRDGSDHRERTDKVIAARMSPQLPLHRISRSADERLASALALAAKT